MATKGYVDAIGALLVNQTGTNNKIELGEETLSELLVLVNEFTFIDTFGSSAKVAAVNAPGKGSIIIQKVPNQVLTEKTKLGGKDADNVELKPITIEWSKPREAKAGITAFDRDRGLGNALSAYLAKFTEAARYTRDLNGFTALKNEVAKSAANTISATTLGDPEALKRRIIKEAVELTQTVDKDQGINHIMRSDVIIHISEEEAYKLTNVIGNIAEQAFTNGIYYFGTLEGFKIYINPLLPKVPDKPKVILGTTFSYSSFHSITAAGIDKLPGSADEVAYYEDGIAEGLIYDNTIRVLY